MEATQNHIEALRQRTRQGSYQAREQLEQELGPHMVRKVRRVLRQGQATDRFGKLVLWLAKRLPRKLRRAPRQRQVAALASAVCQMVVNLDWPGGTQELRQATLCA